MGNYSYTYAFDNRGRVTSYHEIIGDSVYTHDCQYEYTELFKDTSCENMPYYSLKITSDGFQDEFYYFPSDAVSGGIGVLLTVFDDQWYPATYYGGLRDRNSSPNLSGGKTYTYNSKGFISHTELNSGKEEFQYYSDYQYQYDSNGYVTVKTDHNTDSYTSDDSFRTTTYSYDSKGFLRQELSVSDSESSASILTIYDYGANNSSLGSF